LLEELSLVLELLLGYREELSSLELHDVSANKKLILKSDIIFFIISTSVYIICLKKQIYSYCLTNVLYLKRIGGIYDR